MTILGPLLIAGLMIAPIYLAIQSQEERFIVVNQQESFILENTELLRFTTIPDIEANNLIKDFNESPYYALYINEDIFTLYSNQQISLSVSKDIETQIEQIIEKNNFKKAGINPEIIKNATEDIHIYQQKIIDKEGNKALIFIQKQVWVLDF